MRQVSGVYHVGFLSVPRLSVKVVCQSLFINHDFSFSLFFLLPLLFLIKLAIKQYQWIRSLTSSHLSWMLKRKRALSSFTSTLMNLMSCYLGWREIKRNADHKALGRWEEGSREEWRVLIDLSGSLSHQRGRTTIGHSRTTLGHSMFV